MSVGLGTRVIQTAAGHAASVPVAAPVQIFARRAAVMKAARGTAVVVGVTGTCPYGIGACWGGAYEALSQLEGVDMVNPIPDAVESTAEVFLKDEGLPPLDRWGRQFSDIVNGTYELRGVEVANAQAAREGRGPCLQETRRRLQRLPRRPTGDGNRPARTDGLRLRPARPPLRSLKPDYFRRGRSRCGRMPPLQTLRRWSVFEFRLSQSILLGLY
jgi:hypothetical protein